MPRQRSTAPIPGPPAGGRRSYLDQVIDHDTHGNPVTVADRVIAAIRAGNYLETAASLAGVRPDTVRTWLYTGNGALRAIHNGTPPHQLPRNELRYAEFALALTKAEAEAEAEDVARLQQLARGQATSSKRVTTERRDSAGALVEQTVRTETETLAPDSAALRWRLERRHPRRWFGRQRIELTGEDGGPVELTVAEKRAHVLEVLATVAAERQLDEGEYAEATG